MPIDFSELKTHELDEKFANSINTLETNLNQITVSADGTINVVGADGKTAYEIAVANGFVGTEKEWLFTLKGDDGPAGADGLSAYEIAVKDGYKGTEEEWLASLKGDKGDKGETGNTGPQGPKGEAGYTPVKGKDYFDGQDGFDGLTTSVTVNNQTYTQTAGNVVLPNYPTTLPANGGNADTVDSVHLHPNTNFNNQGAPYTYVFNSGDDTNCYPCPVSSLNVASAVLSNSSNVSNHLICTDYAVPIEIGQYVDMHTANSSSDYDTRIYLNNNHLHIHSGGHDYDINDEIANLKNISVNGKQTVATAINGVAGTSYTSSTPYDDMAATIKTLFSLANFFKTMTLVKDDSYSPGYTSTVVGTGKAFVMFNPSSSQTGTDVCNIAFSGRAYIFFVYNTGFISFEGTKDNGYQTTLRYNDGDDGYKILMMFEEETTVSYTDDPTYGYYMRWKVGK